MCLWEQLAFQAEGIARTTGGDVPGMFEEWEGSQCGLVGISELGVGEEVKEVIGARPWRDL